jgi:PAS domain S-box-containing protein
MNSRPDIGVTIEIQGRSGRWLTVGFIVVMLVFIVLGLSLVGNINGYLDDLARARKSRSAMASLQSLVSGLKDVQRGVRGYVITGDTLFLRPYKTGLSETINALGAISPESIPDPATQARLDMIHSFSGKLIDELERQRGLVDRHQADSARAIARAGESSRALEAVGNVVQQMLNDEERTRNDRNAEANAHLRGSVTELVSAAALFLAFLVVIFLFMKRQLRERNRLAAKAGYSEQRLLTVVDSLREGITFSNTEGRFEIFNASMKELTGYTREEANRSGDFSRLIYPDPADRQKALDGVQTIIAHQGAHTSETIITTKTGAKRLLRISSQMIRSFPQRMFLTTYQDITDNRKIEDATRESEQRYRLMFETSPTPALVYDEQSLAILAVNDVAVTHYGYTKDEFLGMTIKELRPEEDIPALLEHLSSATSSVHHSGIWNHRKKDGTIIAVDIRSHSIPWEGHNGRLVMIHDVTERMRIENELRIQKAYFERLFNAMPEGIALLDGAGIIRNVNRAYENILGYSHDEVVGKPVTSINVPDEYLEEVADTLEAVMSGVGISLETVRTRKDGTGIDLSIIATPIELGGDQRMVYAIYRDITQRKRSEHEREELIEQLQKALAEVKTLSGLLPICAWCKKVRDDQGYYHQIDAYIAAHSHATFTHGICPDCLETVNREMENGARAARDQGERQEVA